MDTKKHKVKVNATKNVTKAVPAPPLFQAQAQGGGRKAGGAMRSTPLKNWGLLRNVVAKFPSWFCSLEIMVAQILHIAVHLFLVFGVLAEVLGGFGRPGTGGSAASNQLLFGFVYDNAFGCIQSFFIATRAIGLPGLGESSTVVLRRIALLQSIAATLLHVSFVVRWRRRSSQYSAPPLFALLAYFAAPWCNLSLWLLRMEPSDHLRGGGVSSDLLAIVGIFGARMLFFGSKGLPRAPKERQRFLDWLLDAATLLCAVAAVDAIVLRSHWLEERKNWKYILCAINMAWPVFYWPQILKFFRNAANKKQTTRSSREKENYAYEDYGGPSSLTGSPMMSPNGSRGLSGRSKTMVVSGSTLREAKKRLSTGSGVRARPAALKAAATVAQGALTAVPSASARLSRLRQILGPPSFPKASQPPGIAPKQLPVAGLGHAIEKTTDAAS